MFSILNEIANNSHFRTTSVVVSSIGSSGLIYILVAWTGYLSFGNAVSGNIVGMCKYTQIILFGLACSSHTIDPPSTSSTIGKAAIVILVMFSYPLQVHPCRASVDAVLKWRPKGRSNSTPNSPPRQTTPSARNTEISEVRFAAITTGIIVLSYIAAMTISSLEKVLAYVGSTGSTAISFILPGLFYYKISAPEGVYQQRLMKEDDDETVDEEGEGLLSGGGGTRWSTGSKAWRQKLLRNLSLALAIYGFVVMAVCLSTNTFLIASH